MSALHGSRGVDDAGVAHPFGFTLIEVMVSVAIVAILAVVAVPQFTHHMRLARTAEATLMLDVIKKGASAYYASPRTTADGIRLPCQFPSVAPLTPALPCCDPSNDSDGDARCDSNPKAFDNVGWAALNFGLSDAHIFQYAFAGQGELGGAHATISAHADQDCNGTQSTFRIVLRGDPSATLSGCDSTTSAGFFHEFETE